jgi:hypothetical protein
VKHRASFTSFTRGYHPIAGFNGRPRKVYGTVIRCSCGWRLKTNERRPRAMDLHRRHRDAMDARPTWSPAGVGLL